MPDDDDEGFVFAATQDARGATISGMSLGEARRRSEEERLRAEARFRSAPFPLYGLPPTWAGGRFLGGGWWGGPPGQDRTHALSLVHGALVQGEAPILSAETGTRFSIGGGELMNAAGMVWEGMASTIGEAFEELTRDDASWDFPAVLPIRTGYRLSVDGVATSFDAFVDGESWVARADIGANFFALEGTSFDPADVELVRISDIEPYILGTRRFYERR